MAPKRKSDGGNAGAAKKSKTAEKATKQTSETTDSAAEQASPAVEETVNEAALKEAVDKKIAARSKRWSKVSASRNLDAHYWTINKDPAKAYAFETIDNPDKKTKCGKSCLCGKPLDDKPNHQYALTSAGLYKYKLSGTMVDVRDPDGFGMYTFNDHASYGALEVLRNLMVDFDEAFAANDMREMWVNVETIAMHLKYGQGDSFCMCDDGEMVKNTMEVLAKMPLAAIAAIDAHTTAEGENAWQPRNVGFVMSLYIKLASDWAEQDLLEAPEDTPATRFKWEPGCLDEYLLALAKERKVKLVGIEKGTVEAAPAIALPKMNKKDPWGWTKSFKELKKSGAPTFRGSKGVFGGDSLDLTSWSSKERKEKAFDRVDPLDEKMRRDLEEGMVMMRG